jgi:hypothetical protein
MPQASQIEGPWDPIQGVAADFEACARRAIECMLNRPTLLSKTFGPNTHAMRPLPEPGILCHVESGNPGQSFRISLGISKSDLRSLFSDEKDEEMGRDAIGEILNVIAGTLFGRPAFRSAFGFLRASVPSFAAPRSGTGTSRIIRGALLVGSARMILELAVDSGMSGGKE